VGTLPIAQLHFQSDEPETLDHELIPHPFDDPTRSHITLVIEPPQ
jgi:hypothetical protein